MEAGVLIDLKGEPLYWHLPENRSVVSLPDSPTLWDRIYKNRKIISGFAHSHPGTGIPSPSYEDITTFAAIESGLGQRLQWWITSKTDLIIVYWSGKDRLNYKSLQTGAQPIWLKQLRHYSLDYV